MTKTMWAVGEQDNEIGWRAVDAPDEAAAIDFFRGMNDFEIDGPLMAIRVPRWDALDWIDPVDWINSGVGLTYSCTYCGEQCNAEGDNPAYAKQGTIICGDCQAE